MIQVTLIETSEGQDLVQRMRIVNESSIKHIGINDDYETVVTLIDGEQLFVEEEYMAFFDHFDTKKVGV